MTSVLFCRHSTSLLDKGCQLLRCPLQQCQPLLECISLLGNLLALIDQSHCSLPAAGSSQSACMSCNPLQVGVVGRQSDAGPDEQGQKGGQGIIKSNALLK